MNNIIGGVSPTGVDVSGIDATVAGEQVTVSRKEVTKENTFKKFLAMLASTVLSIKTTAREDISHGQINVNNAVPVVILPPNPGRLTSTLRNIGGKNAYIGSYGVTTTTGYLLKSTDNIPLQLTRTWGAVYAISDDAAGTIVAFIEE